MKSFFASRNGQDKEPTKEFYGKSSSYSCKRFLSFIRTKKQLKTTQKKQVWKDLSGKARGEQKERNDRFRAE